MSKKEVKLKGVMDVDQVVTYLEDLATSLKEGKICVQQGEQFVTLCPDKMVDVEVKATSKKGKEKFEMELAWYRDVSQEMSISSDEPEQDAESEGSPPAVSGPVIEMPQAQDEDNIDRS
ncbi:amphi-Trp domain-containing protein [Desulfonatronum sp. SC1]|uniref:amphi-Trp domain-containing protein n=1 Tax=Desulfonatronum sp. SC1 TaxID=2109626 RepID=UPI001304AB77|nr:amphi-Trp domain-containing protein [Desulfonatronum sp. SC1]